jgi:hypothetical protein
MHCERCGAPVRVKRDFTGVMVNGIMAVVIAIVGGIVVYKRLQTTTQKDSTALTGRIDQIGN